MIPDNCDVDILGSQLTLRLNAQFVGVPIVGVEVGTFRGQLAEYLLTHMPDLTLVVVDSWGAAETNSPYYKTDDPHSLMDAGEHNVVYNDCCERLKQFGERAKIIRKPSLDAASDFENAAVDFVFLDADHSYEGVQADLKAWTPKVKPGGLMSGHDYNNMAYQKTRVKDAVDEFFGKPPQVLRSMTWFMEVPK